MRSHWTEIEKYLEDQKIAQELIGELRDFHMRYTVEDQVKERVEKPDILFYGKKILEMSTAALLQGDNLLLSGAKATGKNVLCETLAWIFGRPEYDISAYSIFKLSILQLTIPTSLQFLPVHFLQENLSEAV